MGIQKRLSGVGFAKQTAKGSAASTPVYGLGLLGGSVYRMDVNQEAEAIAYGKRVSPDENRLGIAIGTSFRARAYPRSLPALLYGALGALASSGPVSGVYTHAATPALDLPWWTFFLRYDAEYAKVPDCKIDELVLSWSERGKLEVEATVLGLSPALGEAAWTATNDEVGQERFGPLGGTLKVDAASGTPSEGLITAGRISIANGLTARPVSKQIVADDLLPGEQAIEAAVTLQPDSFAEWRKILTGSAGGTAVTGSAVYGSVDHLMAIDANTTLQLVADRVAFLADLPEADPSGGHSELELVGRVKQPAAGEAITATTKNAVATY